jgi:tagatose 1,6-diphosphate aldolase GatY/KbaY
MPLVNTKDMLLRAQKEGYAIGAFNIENMEMVQAVVAAAVAQQAPVIVQTTPGTVKYASLALYHANVLAAAQTASVPVALHLDHGDAYPLASQAYRAGYTSIMIDGSREPLEKNIAVTCSVVGLCRPGGVPVEGELGKVGGKEDDRESGNGGYTDVNDAMRFVKETGVDSLAVGIGTAHGVYSETPVLDLDLLGRLRGAIDVPLVLHGASGLEDEVVKECIRRGMSKVNYATELRIAYTEAVAAFIKNNPSAFDPKQYGAKGREAVQALVEGKMQVCGCSGKA